MSRQITELPEIKPVMIETRQHEVTCPACGSAQRGALPVGLEARRHFGPRLEATVTHMQHQQHLSYERTRAALADLFGVTLIEGGQACIIERAGQAAQPVAEGLRAGIRRSAVVHSGETGARVANARAHLVEVGVYRRDGGVACHPFQPGRRRDSRGHGIGAGGHLDVRLLEASTQCPGRALSTLAGASDP